MHKRTTEREKQRLLDEQKRKRRNTRNMIISIASLAAAIFCYYFLDSILGIPK